MPAETAEIEFAERGESLRVDRPPPPSGPASAAQIRVGGWQRARSGGEALRGGLPVLWTPQIKALWAPLVLPSAAAEGEAEPLALHRLRLSATSLRLQWCAPVGLGLGLGLGLGPASGRSSSGPPSAQPQPATASPRPASASCSDTFWLAGHTDLLRHTGAASRARETSAPRCLSASRLTACASRSGVRSPRGCDWLLKSKTIRSCDSRK